MAGPTETERSAVSRCKRFPGSLRIGMEGGFRSRGGSLLVDAVLYGAAALWAGVVALTDAIPLQRSWATLAFVPYLAAASIALGGARRARGARGSRLDARPRILPIRLAGASVAIVGALAIPLVVHVVLRGEGPGPFVQSEALMVEEAATALIAGSDPYAVSYVDGPLGAWPGGTANHVPYMPGMLALGVPRALAGVAAWTDARVWIAVVAAAASAAALGSSRADRGARLTVALALFALPIGARYLTGSGTDIPVLALMALALVAADRRRPVLAGLALGVAAAMKQTAWPLVPFLALAARDRSGAPAGRRFLGAALGIPVAVAAPFLLADARAFVEDTVLFPLGLAGSRTLAESPTLGALVARAFPSVRGIVGVVALAAVGALALVLLMRRPRPDVPAAARRAALVLASAILLAPAGRFGYLIYPLHLALWSHLLVSADRGGAAAAPAPRDEPAERRPALPAAV